MDSLHSKIEYEALSKACPGGQALRSGNATGSANYFMYCYKVVLCPKEYSHDWGACPFAHEKEKARRRDPQLFNYSSCICPNSSMGECPNGLDCPYAHTLFEYWLHPSRFRTTMCRSGSDCKRSLCFFAHCMDELRKPTTCGPSNQNQPVLGTPALLPAATASSYTPSASAAVTKLLAMLPENCRRGSDASLSRSAQDMASWPSAVESSSGGSFTSQVSTSAQFAGSSMLQMPPTTNCMMRDTVTPMAGSSSSSSRGPLMFLPASSGMPAAFVNLQQLQQQQQQQQQQAVPTGLLLQDLRLNHNRQQQLELQQLQLQQQQQQQSSMCALLNEGGSADARHAAYTAASGYASAALQDMCRVATATSCMLAGVAAPGQLGLHNMHSPQGCLSPVFTSSNVTLPDVSYASSQFAGGYDSGGSAVLADPLLVAAQQAVPSSSAVQSWV